MKIYHFSKFHTNIVKDKICNSCTLKKLDNKHICGMCSSVRSMRPAEYLKNKLNYFSIFSFNNDFKIDKSKLDSQYKDLQKVLHPDKYAHDAEDVIKEAGECSSFVSNAYQILKDDYNRANYLLKLKGLPYVEESSSTEHNVEFLETLLTLQEQIEDCNSKEELKQIKGELMSKISEELRQVETLFLEQQEEKVVSILKSIKFHTNIVDQINVRL